MSGDTETLILSDRGILEQAIRNLLENAVKYGGRKITVALSQTDKETTIRIDDNGKGIPKTYQKKVFEKFFRVPEENDQHNVKGFGLGLFIVKTSLKRVKGKIALLPDHAAGASFQITLPNG